LEGQAALCRKRSTDPSGTGQNRGNFHRLA
jgi:hypothetical protein